MKHHNHSIVVEGTKETSIKLTKALFRKDYGPDEYTLDLTYTVDSPTMTQELHIPRMVIPLNPNVIKIDGYADPIYALFTKTSKCRGIYPIGVYYKRKNGKFVAQVSKLSDEMRGTKQQEYLGLFDTPEEAFLAYKTEKERYIKQVADYYYNKYPEFPVRLYDALYDYIVDIND